MRKTVLFLAAIVLFAVSASAATYDVGSNTVTYSETDNSNKIRVECVSGYCIDGYAYTYYLKACGHATTKVNPTNRLTSGPDTDYIIANVVPQKLQCSIGTHDLVFEIWTTGLDPTRQVRAEGTLTVKAKNMPNPHRGKALYVSTDLSGSTAESDPIDKMHGFYISNDINDFGWTASTDSGSPGNVFIWDSDLSAGGDDAMLTQPKFGEILSPSTGATMADITGTANAAYFQDSVTNARQVREDNFKASVNHYEMKPAEIRNPDSISPIHNNGEYFPEGELVYAKDPSSLTGGSPGTYWYICRDGATYTNSLGNTIPQPIDAGWATEDPMVCDTSTDSWRDVATCDDGLDNDGDGMIDASNDQYGVPNDPSCGSPDDPESGGPLGCDPANAPSAVVGKTSSGSKAAFYNPQAGGFWTNYRSDCLYNYSDVEFIAPEGQPEKFTCHRNSHNSFSGTDATEKENLCNYISDYTWRQHFEIPSGVVLGDLHMPAVKYYIPEHAIPYGPDYASGLSDGDPDSGFNNDQYQTLHKAEEKYDNGGSTFTCDTCHSASTWSNLNFTGLTGYQNNNPDNYDNAWILSNATGYGTDGVQNTGAPNYDSFGWVNTSYVWGGGFAGNCEPGQIWKRYFEGSGYVWRCSGSVDWTQEVYLPSMSKDSTKAGFIIMPYNFYDTSPRSTSSKFYYPSYNQETSNDAYLDKLEAQCWKGGSSTTYSGAASNNKFAVTITNLPRNPSVPVPVVGTMNHDGTYTCAWNYTDTDGDKFHKLGRLAQRSNTEYKELLGTVPSVASRVSSYNDWSVNGLKLTGTVDSSTLSSVASDWKSTLGLSY